ncbi:hypothetical protein HNP98_000651 [Hymenobacter sp. 9A]|uniref:Uncharacterized protein n=1 Tax=Hymenobacter caeli TaxID=2735894 RepID=A0ABX2FMX9_9BACT|nr:hypothetical protein [Hymenobacter caeli]
MTVFKVFLIPDASFFPNLPIISMSEHYLTVPRTARYS